MLKFIISIYFLFSIGLLYSQENKNLDNPVNKSSSISNFKLKPLNIRIGFDLGNYFYGQSEDLKRVNFFMDTNLYKEYYLNLHAGYEEYLFDNTLINMNTDGGYILTGIEYNLYDNWPGMDNQICIGFSYGYSSFTNTLNSYQINQNSSPYPSQVNQIDKEFSGLTAHWVEIGSNLQVEVLKNIYLGYNISFKYLLSSKKYPEFELTYIPGFRKVNSTSNFGFGMQYFISYRFKLKKAPK
jgi:hypothetical protein